MQIDLFSDPICPWCYIGKTQLRRALASDPGPLPDLELRWRMFRLNPLMPAGGMDRQSYLERKFGGADAAATIYRRIAEAGAAAGLQFNFDRISRTPDTLRAHQLIRFAQAHGRGDEVTDALFAAYFERGQDIGDPDVLADEAAAVGLDRPLVSALLESDRYVAQLEAEELSARRAGISGVPFFLFGGKHGLSGAQPPKAFHHLFDLMRAEAAPKGA